MTAEQNKALVRRLLDRIRDKDKWDPASTVGEQFLEHAPVAFALYFLGVPANYGDCCVAHG